MEKTRKTIVTVITLVLLFLFLTQTVFAVGKDDSVNDLTSQVQPIPAQKTEGLHAKVGACISLIDLDDDSLLYVKKTICWKSSDTTVAVVSNAGDVQCIAPGKARITASAGKKKRSWNIVVEDSYEVFSDDFWILLHTGDTEKLFFPPASETADGAMQWKIKDETVVSVNPDTSEVTALSVGETAVAVRLPDGNAVRIPVYVIPRIIDYDELREEFLYTGKPFYNVDEAVENGMYKADPKKATYKNEPLGIYASMLLSDSDNSSLEQNDVSFFRLLVKGSKCLSDTSSINGLLKNLNEAKVFFEGSELYACSYRNKQIILSEEYYLFHVVCQSKEHDIIIACGMNRDKGCVNWDYAVLA